MTDNINPTDEFKNFFEFYSAVETERKKALSRGVNDFSLLKTVHNVNDETKLHSRFLAEFLNRNGSHEQGALFLKIFMQKIERGSISFFSNLERVRVHREWAFHDLDKNGKLKVGYIDLLLEDGDRFLIIENKLNAQDQPKQVERYVRAVRKIYGSLNEDDIIFAYLTKGRKIPSDSSMGSVTKDENNYLELGGKKEAKYLNIWYQKEIIDWIDASRQEVLNITNLNNALTEYKQVVELALKRYKRKIMSIPTELFPKDLKPSEMENIRFAFDLISKQDEIKAQALDRLIMNPFKEELKGAQEVDAPSGFSKYEGINDSRAFIRKKGELNKGKYYKLSNGNIIFLVFATKHIHLGCSEDIKLNGFSGLNKKNNKKVLGYSDAVSKNQTPDDWIASALSKNSSDTYSEIIKNLIQEASK